MARFTFNNGGSDELVIVRRAKRLPAKLASELFRIWDEQARKELTAGGFYERYRRAMQQPSLVGSKIVMRLGGTGDPRADFDALKLEMGWAPPQAGGSGLGEYNGQMKDMRPMLLRGAEMSAKTGHRYAFIPVPVQKSTNEVIAEANEAIRNRFFGRNTKEAELADFAERLRATKAPSQTETGRGEGVHGTGLPADAASRRGRGMRRPATFRFEGITRMLSDRQIARARASGHRARRTESFIVIRTVTDDPEQKARYVWFSKGTKPRRVLAAVKARLAEAVKKAGEK